MKLLIFDSADQKENLKISKKDQEKLLFKINEISFGLKKKYDTQYAFLNLPKDQMLIDKIKNLSEKIKKLKPSALFLIGIGGSNLGAVAVIEALLGKYGNDLNPEIKFYCVDTIDNDQIKALLNIAQKEITAGNKIIINIITKSGTTIETLANGSIFINLLKKNFKNYQDYIVITTDQDSPMHKFAKKSKFNILEIPTLVGGRYSVFSAVGLFPLALLDIDIDNLLLGASDILEFTLSSDYKVNFSYQSAYLIYKNYQDKKVILDTFIFNPDLFSLGLWYRQLFAESLGKKRLSDNKPIDLTPTISIGTTDLHSMLQLYLDGNHNKFTTFISIDKESHEIQVSDDFNEINPALNKKTLTIVKEIIFKAINQSYKNHNLPFVNIFLPQKNSYFLGQLMMFKMCEIIFLADLFEVNPFDQPAVEDYKKIVKNTLV